MKIRSACLILALALSACGEQSVLTEDSGGGTPPPSSAGDTRDCAVKYSITQNPVLTGADPRFGEQWHLLNTFGASPADLRATQAWLTTKGENARVAVVDDAIEVIHPDLSENVVAGGSYNYFGGSSLPLPCGLNDDHGTQVTGILAARDANGIGLAGVAPRTKLVGFNALEAGTDQAIIDAMQRDNQLNQIFHNSWGSSDDGFQHPADSGWSNAIDQGLKNGRAGKGSIFVFAPGNGGSIELNNSGSEGKALHVDNSNFDGYVNRIGVIAACATDDNGQRAFFGEFGVNQLVCAPAYSSQRKGVVTTTYRGSYSDDFIGTSASAPMISGVAALMLSANQNLTWRDVPIILARTARKTNPNESNWDGTGAARYNPFLGFGIADAEKAVALAKTWQSVGDSNNLVKCGLYTRTPNLAVPNTPNVATDTLTIGTDCAIRKIEFIDVFITSDHPYAADMRLRLISPSGAISQLTYSQSCGRGLSDSANPCKAKLNNWRFGVVRHMDETSLGNWKLEAIDNAADSDSGQINSWSMQIWGRP
jgi:subtilisin family serine protease